MCNSHAKISRLKFPLCKQKVSHRNAIPMPKPLQNLFHEHSFRHWNCILMQNHRRNRRRNCRRDRHGFRPCKRTLTGGFAQPLLHTWLHTVRSKFLINANLLKVSSTATRHSKDSIPQFCGSVISINC